MCTIVGRGILAACTNNAQCLGMEHGRQERPYDGGYFSWWVGTELASTLRNLKSDNLNMDVRACVHPASLPIS